MQVESGVHEIIHIHPDRDIVFRVFKNSHDIAPLHWHDEIELNYIVKGTVIVTIDGNRDTLDAGDCIIVNSRIIHSADGSPGNDGILLQFPLEFLRRYVPDVDNFYFDLETHNRDPKHQKKLMMLKSVLDQMAVVDDVQPAGGGILRFNSLLFELLFELCHNFSFPLTKSGISKQKRAFDALAPVIDYTRDHFTEPVAIADVAAVAHLQPDYFCRKFKKLMGQTYLEYLNDVRLAYVYEDLIHTDLRLNRILEKDGFTNYKLFRRLFRGKFGCTPGELRKKHTEGSDGSL